MSLFELFVLAVGLSMDAFAVSICKGLSLGEINLKSSTKVGLWFGGFQAFMPLLGFILGVRFKDYITAIDHWIAFVLLGIIGLNMIKEAVKGGDDDLDASLSVKKMFPLAVATSIDALAVGITFAFLKVKIGLAVLLIGCTTFLLSLFGVYIGNKFGSQYRNKATFAGGVILVLIGTKILLEHTGIIG